MQVIHTPTGSNIRDRNWIRTSFMLAEKDITDRRFRLQTLATQKFTDTRLGGNFTINNLPQYTRTADIRVSGLNAANQIMKDSEEGTRITRQNLGMGRFYSEQIDDNSQQVFMQFGVPEYNGMFSFFTGFYDNDAALLANEGLGKIGYYAGFALGLVVSIAFAPVILLGAVASWFLSRPTSRYYYMKEAMPLYWNRVNLITNSIATNMGLVPRVHNINDYTKIEMEGTEEQQSWREYAHKLAPDIFRPNGGINIYAVANKAQRLADKRYQLEREMFGADSLTDLSIGGIYNKLKTFITGDFGKAIGEPGRDPALTVSDTGIPKREGATQDMEDIHAYLNQYHTLAIGSSANAKKNALTSLSSADVSQLAMEQSATKTTAQSNDAAQKTDYQAGLRDKLVVDKSKTYNNNDPSLLNVQGYGKDTTFMDYWAANQREGSAYVGFRVDHVSTVQESFSTSTRESDISNRVNGISGGSRNLRFNFADGNTGFSMVDGAINAAKGVASGFLDSVHMSGLMSLAGSAFVDIPLQVAESSSSFPTSSYTIELRAPYGHILSRFMNLHVPLSCLLAGALPISTGKQSYAPPMLCSLYCKGKNQIRLGVIDSLSVTRGAGNMGFNNQGECLGIDISFSVKDLSSVLHAPIDAGFDPLRPWKGMLFDDDSVFKDYMAILSNLSLADQTYPLRKMMLNLTRKREAVDTFFSRAHFAQATSGNFLTRFPGTVYGIFTRAGDFTIQ